MAPGILQRGVLKTLDLDVSTIGMRVDMFGAMQNVCRWRGSVFKLIWPDLLLFLLLYCSCSVVYRCALDETQKRVFEKIALVCESFSSAAPISFVLGFYVSIVVSRWWEQYMLIPWPDDICILAASFIQGEDARSRSLRRCFVRYINLAFVLTFSRVSPRVAKSFPSYEYLVKSEYLTPKEKTIMEMVDEMNHHQQVWDPLPLVWASLVVVKARKEGYVPDDHSQEALIHEITNLRHSCSKLQEYNTMSVPLVYTQVVSLACYSYFLCSVLARQFLDPEQGYSGHVIDFYVPVFTILQFIFYMGWLKVAESLLNPFGNDDDDFDTTELLERHIEVSYLIVDDMLKLRPHLLDDLHRNETQEVKCSFHNSLNPQCNIIPGFPKPPYNTSAKSSDNKAQPLSFDSSPSTVEINFSNEHVSQSSRESFCSTATAIPNPNIRNRSPSLSSLSASSNDPCYESCFSLNNHIISKNTTNNTTSSTTQRRWMEEDNGSSPEKVYALKH
ncbi:hypothetical protein SK128_007876 [Halocaridina rubra]|uniref:Bestrophin homolog n=1 Tax=Halocaridina rubra TaxID=373956 RepID=A0AAN9A5L0_HALRR